MTFITNERKSKPTFTAQKELSTIKGPAINNFLGQSITSNIFNMPLGQLIKNKNMEYYYSGNNIYLQTKRGSSLIKDITTRAYGAAVYTYNLATEYIVWVDASGNLKRMSKDGGTITTIQAGLATTTENFFYMFGLNTYSALYGTNETDKLYKISGSTPTYSAIANSPPMKSIAYSYNCGRAIGVFAHTVVFSKVQSAVGNTNNLEDFAWNAGNAWWDNSNQVSEDDGTGFVYNVELNGIMCLFKDTGIWGLVNSREATSDWYFPKLSSDTGTKSAKTVQVCQYGTLNNEGIIFLGSDKTLRLLDVNVDMNSGKIPSLSTKNSHIISKPFQTLLDAIPDGYLSESTGYYWKGYYILNIVGELSTTLNKSIIIDTLKLLPMTTGDTINQPYWFESVNMDFTNFIKLASNNELYGFNKNGYVSSLFISNKHHEEMPTRIDVTEEYDDDGTTRAVAIEYDAYTGWHKYSDNESLLQGFYLNWNSVGDWDLNVTANAFKFGDIIPSYNSNVFTSELSPGNSGLSYFDVARFDVDVFAGDESNLSQQTSLSLRGHYFNFGVYGTKLYQWSTVYSIEPNFKIIRNDPIGLRV